MKAVIFDMDGVIVDSEPLHVTHLYEYLTELGVEEPQRYQRSLKGVSAWDTWRSLVEEFELDHEVETLVHAHRQSYFDYLNSLEQLPSVPGVVALIKYLNGKGYRLALASSASPRRIEMFLSKLKIKRYFEVVTSGDHVDRSKPEPDIFLLAAKRLGVRPKQCIVIEDANNGVRAAHAAGMKCIAYAGSKENDDDLTEAELIVKDFAAFTKGLKAGELPL